MKFVEYYFTPFGNFEFYKLREDGHLFKFNSDDFTFDDVTLTEEYETCWSPLGEWEFHELLAELLEDFNLSHLRLFQEEHPDLLEDYVIGEYLEYYTKNNKVVAIDDNYNQYAINCSVLEFYDESHVDKTWRKMEKWEVVPQVMGMNHKINIKDMELYHIDEGILGCDKYLNQYIFKKTSGPAWLVHEDDIQGIEKLDELTKDEIKHVTEDNNFYDKSILSSDIPRLQKLNNYIKEQIALVGDEISSPTDFVFYKSPYIEDVYALDSKNRVWKVTKQKMFLYEEKDIKMWKKMELKDVYDQIEFSDRRRKRLETTTIPTAYDLRLFKNQDDNYFGYYIDDEGRQQNFFLDEDGEFKPQSLYKKDTSTMTFEDATIVDVLNYQTTCRDVYPLFEYMTSSIEKLKKEGIELEFDFVNFDNPTNDFYIHFDENDHLCIFYKDKNNKEFRCTFSGLVPIPEGTMDDDYKSFPPQRFRHYFNVMKPEEE